MDGGRVFRLPSKIFNIYFLNSFFINIHIINILERGILTQRFHNSSTKLNLWYTGCFITVNISRNGGPTVVALVKLWFLIGLTGKPYIGGKEDSDLP